MNHNVLDKNGAKQPAKLLFQIVMVVALITSLFLGGIKTLEPVVIPALLAEWLPDSQNGLIGIIVAPKTIVLRHHLEFATPLLLNRRIARS